MEQIEKYVDIYNNIIFTYEYLYRYINTCHRYISYVTKIKIQCVKLNYI